MYDPILKVRQPMVLKFGRATDLVDAEPLGKCLCQAIDWACRDVVIDVSGVAFIHSRGLAMMARVHEHGLAQHRSVTWKGKQSWLPRVLEVTGLEPAADADRVSA